MSFGFGFSLPTLGWHLSGGGASSGYSVTKSLRFRSSASAYLSRTFGTPTSGTTWTWSCWFKRGTISSGLSEFFTGNTVTAITALEFQSTDTLYFGIGNGATSYGIQSISVFRDPAAWYHVVVVSDTTQASGTITGIATDRLRMYINGSQITSFVGGSPTPPPQNFTGNWNQNGTVGNIGRYTAGASRYFDGEMAEVNFVDGQALVPTAFGAFSIYNQWLPKKYAGTYGTNGFYLPFTNTASTSTLVADSSGNANNWTPNNISLTAGSTYDSLTDVPTLTSTTVANYAVLNPLGNVVGTQALLSNGNLTASGDGWGNSTISLLAPGKFYFEYKIATVTAPNTPYCGLASIGADVTAYVNDGRIFLSGSVVTTVATYTSGDVIACAYDTAGTVTFYKNNTSVYSGPYAYRANLFFLTYANNSTASVNFGQQPFTYTPPSGFLPLNTFNI